MTDPIRTTHPVLADAPMPGAASSPTVPPGRWAKLTAYGPGVLLMGVAIGLTTAVIIHINHDQASNDRTAADASACLAVINTGVLLDNMTAVPSTTMLQGALEGSGANGELPVAVRVVQRSPQAIDVVFPDEVARAQPDLVRFYTNVPFASLAHPGCPMTADARDMVKRTVDAMYNRR